MSNFAYTQEQNLVLSSNKSLINVGFDYKDMALCTLMLLAYDSFKLGQKILIYAPLQKDRDDFKQLLESIHLESLTLFIDSKSDISQLKSAFLARPSSENFTFDFIDHSVQKLKHQQLSLQTHKAIDQKFLEVLTQERWREILDKYAQLPPHTHTLYLYNHLSKYDIRKQDFKKTLDIVRLAIEIYDKNYEFVSMDYTHMGIKSLWVDEVHIDSTLNAIKGFRSTAQVLILQYHTSQKNIIEHLDHLDKTWHSDQTQLVDKIDTLYRLYLDFAKSDKKGNFLTSLFRNEAENPSQKLKRTIQSYFDHLINELKKKNFVGKPQSKDLLMGLDNDITSIRQFLHTFSAQYSQKNQEYVRHINRFNFVYPHLQELEQQLLNLFDTINDKDIFNTRLEANSISFIKQMESLEALIIQLEKTINGLEKNISYLKWHSFVSGMNEYHQVLIKSLQRIPQAEWERAFLSYGYYSVLAYHRWDPIEEELYDSFEALKKLSVNHTIHEFLTKSDENLEKLKKENPNLYHYLYKNKPLSDYSSWKWLLKQHAGHISDFFPIVVIDSQDIEDISSHTFDTLVVFDAPNIHPNILQLCPKLITFWREFDATLMDNTLTTTHKVNVKINEVPVSQRFELCQSLTSLLASIHQWPRVFTLRNTCILSYASSYIEKEIVNALYHSGIKSMSMNDNPVELLESVMIDSTENVVVILEDSLFVPYDICPIIEQQFIKKNLENAGFVVLDVSSLQLFEQSEKTIEDIKQTLFQYLQNN